jgi:hypothetical protein
LAGCLVGIMPSWNLISPIIGTFCSWGFVVILICCSLVVLSTVFWKFDEALQIGIRRYVCWAKDNRGL